MKNSPFVLIFAAVLSLTIASGGTAIAIANRPTVTDQQERILDSAIALFTMGSTTIIGLLNHQPSDDKSAGAYQVTLASEETASEETASEETASEAAASKESDR
ncbi:MAG: hypothetical protein F6K09_31365 [Merismopedia sp. SIO2A8]|nr:hypothetical protein [Symploca sp. SIO2B6]NET53007.1 hypothetical protein [Merismopedia sp. SIO2A8]